MRVNKRSVILKMKNSGFTLIELMVVLAIVVVISLLVLISASRFNSAILLRSLAYEVGLSVREAQLYGVAVKGAGSQYNNVVQCSVGIKSQFCASYGVHFVYPTPPLPAPSYFIFADVNNSGVYIPPSVPRPESFPTPSDLGDPLVDKFSIQYGFIISNLCALNGSTWQCAAPSCPVLYPSCQPNTVSSIDISFRRPSPVANIMVSPTNGGPPYSGNQVYIEIASPNGSTRAVTVSQTGQIVITGTQ